MNYIVSYNGLVLGKICTSRTMTNEEICKCAGVSLARTEEDYFHSPENGKYILEELKIDCSSKKLSPYQNVCEKFDCLHEICTIKEFYCTLCEDHQCRECKHLYNCIQHDITRIQCTILGITAEELRKNEI